MSDDDLAAEIELLRDMLSDALGRIEQLEGAVFDQWPDMPRVLDMPDLSTYEDRPSRSPAPTVHEDAQHAGDEHTAGSRCILCDVPGAWLCEQHR